MGKVASELDVSVEQLRRFFVVYMPANFEKWRKHLRLRTAKDLLLRMPDSPIEAIGIMVGISDKANFRKQFLEVYGMTPTAWRAKKERRCRINRWRRALKKSEELTYW